MKLEGSVVVVTGASDRLGGAIARSLARQGASVLVHCHTDTVHADETVDSIRASGGTAARVASDLTTMEGVEAVVGAVMDRFGRWNALINNASRFDTVGIEEITVEQYMADQNLHLRAPFFLSKALYEQVRATEDRKEDACVVNITDTGVRRPVPSRPSYYLAKAGLEEQTRVLGRALAPYVRVNAVAPGAVIPASESDLSYFDRLASREPLQQLASVEDMLSTLLFLLRTESITGQTIVVDGGEHLL
ncbi:MAG TPA: SDR family oxidoreductase [Sphaerochaetaceae bacterium]|nr:SDR family oxidoreductase [Sphaerochaetaceae bacterium]